jgi:hypothetical protein
MPTEISSRISTPAANAGGGGSDFKLAARKVHSRERYLLREESSALARIAELAT